jgi:hypothetical protein
MVLILHPPQVRFLATCHTLTSTTNRPSLSTGPMIVITATLLAILLAILLVALQTATIAGTTAPNLVEEGMNLSIDKVVNNGTDSVFRYHDERDYDSEDGSKYVRRSSRYD